VLRTLLRFAQRTSVHFKKRDAFHFKMRSIISRQLVAISSEAAASQLFNERVKYYDQQYNSRLINGFFCFHS
jgi:hypothetical protein